ncbi:hypothetical protein [Jeongeupia naejangsanensis]|uniref:Uncharacterized protein n=1 Tax=Jeongeupia naejangsanensis TaxID=613195 RepID=A0ABS2BH59_9NEIS|nr:hypothetical protein [Jeongeupia naejangsanensis]MBM3114952.1 hypothetical protein [Jeongeupia naejangsanensis]
MEKHKYELTKHLEHALDSNNKKLEELINESKKEIAKEIGIIDALGNGRSFHQQALSMRDIMPASAASDALSAVMYYAAGNDERNLRAALVVWEECIPKCTNEELETFQYDRSVNDAIKALEGLNKNGRYAEDIRSIARENKKAMLRTKESTADIETK